MQEGLQRMKSMNNKPMPMELMQQLAERLGQYAEDDNMERECHTSCLCQSLLSRYYVHLGVPAGVEGCSMTLVLIAGPHFTHVCAGMHAERGVWVCAEILAIIRESQPVDIAQNNGEVELDFDALEPATLWRLYEFTENMARPTTISPADSEASDSDDSGDELE